MFICSLALKHSPSKKRPTMTKSRTPGPPIQEEPEIKMVNNSSSSVNPGVRKERSGRTISFSDEPKDVGMNILIFYNLIFVMTM